MKRLLLPALLLPSAAAAHPGGHGEFSLSTALAHALSQPDHLIGLVALAGLSALGWHLWSRRKVATQMARK